MATKRGPYSMLDPTEQKRRRTERLTERGKHKIFIGGQLHRWTQLKDELQLKTHQELARLLLDSYDQARQAVETIRPTPVKWTHSTPLKQTRAFLPVPLLSASEISSGISDAEPEPGPSSRDNPKESLGSERRRSKVKNLSSIYADPLQITLSIIEEQEEKEDAEDNGVYEPSCDITLDLNNGDEMKDVAMANVVFGEENENDEHVEELTQKDVGVGVTRAVDAESVDSFLDDRTVLVYCKQIKLLANHCFLGAKCRVKTCNGEISIQEKIVGSLLFLTWVCPNNHTYFKWSSQPVLNRMLAFGDLMLSGSILASGNNFAKIKLLAKCLNLCFPHQTTFAKIQRSYVVPAVEELWHSSQEILMNDLKGKKIVCLGDGRMDSPGHCAQYCSYTIMDNDTKKILAISTVDKREVQKKSALLEKAGFVRCLNEVLEKGIQVTEVVTDAHPQITSLMKLQYDKIKHSHDIWHAAKNLCKKIMAAGQVSECRLLQEWSRDITNHFWYACKEASTKDEWMAIWCGVLHHVCNEHLWAVSYCGLAEGKCSHAELSAEERSKSWIVKGSPPHNALVKIVLNTRLLNKVPYFLNFRHTSEIESFQNHILMYASKRFAYTPPVYKARNILAALDYNTHVDRPLMKNKQGEICYNRSYNKKSGRWAAYPIKVEKTYPHLREMFQKMFCKRLDDNVGMSQKMVLSQDDPRRLSSTIARTQPEATRQIVESQLSRFT